ncbi:MAG: acyltransferase family protein [Polaribacter sp.]|nr:acyltransferase family protein [Polaribacter sp.]
MSSKLIHRIPSLDGIRGLSILMVVFGHAFRNYFHLIDIANLGVRIFFIISAYLIVGIFISALISYYLIEKPSLNFRNKLLLKYNK